MAICPGSWEYINRILRYDPNDGELYWRVDRGGKTRAGGPASMPYSGGRRIHTIYNRTKIDGIRYMSASIVLYLVYGIWPPFGADHLNHNETTNDRLTNLRYCPSAEARRAYQRNGPLWGIKKRNGKFGVIVANIWRGTFERLEEAIKVRDESAISLWGDCAPVIRKPEDDAA